MTTYERNIKTQPPAEKQRVIVIEDFNYKNDSLKLLPDFSSFAEKDDLMRKSTSHIATLANSVTSIPMLQMPQPQTRSYSTKAIMYPLGHQLPKPYAVEEKPMMSYPQNITKQFKVPEPVDMKAVTLTIL